ncbi:hypothetical protein [Paenibacillus sp. 1781tsa1]|uniref:hypothetical protein n=1 Tax=Paenibacillus sp. 1781tsa1 TaxID=2953810 RepID=UPI0020A06A58|nr:hypothetical protein [Paenibacillus sp. 1781tsa1]MCP1182677.1 hypothetical protein [Paenibacillus sp. 1781tsa1]
MRISRLMKLSLIVLLMYMLMIPASTNVVQSAQNYQWKNIPIGGGGYVTGVVIHPTEPDLVYARTDVGGAYRLDAASGDWVPLLDHFGDEDSNLYGVDGIALDQQNPNIVYIAAGKYGNVGPSDILKSTDRGETWVRTGLNLRNESNGNIHRAMGESIAVNPTNSNYLHVGTRYDGLYTSSDGAATWSKVWDVPNGLAGEGIRSVAYGLNPVTKQGQVVYAGVRGIGVYSKAPRSNGQTTWQLTGRSPEYPARMTVAKNGTLYVTTDNQGVYKFNGVQWTNITPSSSYSSYYGITIDPNNDNHILAAVRTGGDNLPLYRSVNGGQSWTTVSKTLVSKPSWWTPNMFFSATSSIKFDPHHPGTVYATDWFGVYKTDNINGTNGLTGNTASTWEAITDGHEEVVALTASTPPQGVSFFSGLTDQVGFRHENVSNVPLNKIPLSGMREIVSIDYHEANPNYMIFLGSSDWYGTTTRLFVSSNNGVTVTPMNVPAGSILGRVAYSAINPNVIVYYPQTGNPVRSTNRGATWQNMNGAPFQAIGGNMVFSYNHPLAADRINGYKFYMYAAGYLYRSTDAGANWSKANAVRLPYNTDINTSFIKVEAAPGVPNAVWVSLGTDGLYASMNSGNTFSKIQGVQNSKLFAFGKAKPGNFVPAVYVYGTVNNVHGFFRSDDMGATWNNIGPLGAGIGLGNEPQIMAADRQIYGQVYVGTNGRGMYVGSIE